MNRSRDDTSLSRPTTSQRIISVLGGIAFIFLVAITTAESTALSRPITCLAIVSGAIVEILIICELSKRFFLSGNRNKRFGLGTLMLVMTGLLIMLRGSDPTIFSTAVLVVVSILFVVISTIILTRFAEALVWAVAGLWREAHSNDEQDSDRRQKNDH